MTNEQDIKEKAYLEFGVLDSDLELFLELCECGYQGLRHIFSPEPAKPALGIRPGEIFLRWG